LDRDKKALTLQIEKLQQSLDHISHVHAEQMATRDAAHLQQLQDIRDALQQRQQEWVRGKCGKGPLNMLQMPSQVQHQTCHLACGLKHSLQGVRYQPEATLQNVLQ
jgi:hypothetical protein